MYALLVLILTVVFMGPAVWDLFGDLFPDSVVTPDRSIEVSTKGVSVGVSEDAMVKEAIEDFIRQKCYCRLAEGKPDVLPACAIPPCPVDTLTYSDETVDLGSIMKTTKKDGTVFYLRQDLSTTTDCDVENFIS